MTRIEIVACLPFVVSCPLVAGGVLSLSDARRFGVFLVVVFVLSSILGLLVASDGGRLASSVAAWMPESVSRVYECHLLAFTPGLDGWPDVRSEFGFCFTCDRTRSSEFRRVDFVLLLKVRVFGRFCFGAFKSRILSWDSSLLVIDGFEREALRCQRKIVVVAFGAQLFFFLSVSDVACTFCRVRWLCCV